MVIGSHGLDQPDRRVLLMDSHRQNRIAGKGEPRLNADQWLWKRMWTFVFLNIVAVVWFAALHTYAPPLRATQSFEVAQQLCLVALQACLLFAPCVLIGVLVRWRWPRFGGWATFGMTLAISAIYLIDFALFLTIREHLLTRVFVRFAAAVTPNLYAYITLDHWLRLAACITAWSAVQFGVWKSTAWICRRTRRRGDLGMPAVGTLIALMIALMSAVLYPAWRTDRVVELIHARMLRHPLTATGFFRANHAPRLREHDFETLRGRAHLLAHADVAAEQIKAYRKLSIRPRTESGLPSGRRPDVLIVLSECLRPDVITADTMPNVYDHARQGLWATQHYSTGNVSSFGFFGLMFGLDPCWYEWAAILPMGMFAGLRQAGYETAFFGYDANFEMFDMHTFCGADRFDFQELLPAEHVLDGDEMAAARVADFLARRGDFATSRDVPRLALLYVYAPHDNLYRPQDALHPAESGAAGWPPNHLGRPRNPAEFANYLKSIHFLDRLIAPLITPERVILVTGDHGQSFGEDGRSIHGTGMSAVQIGVGLVAFGPHIPPTRISTPTSHIDLLPTLLDILDLESVPATLLPGTSLLREIPAGRILSSRGLVGSEYLFIKPDRAIADRQLGYLGFFRWRPYQLAPGAVVDRDGEAWDRASQPGWQQAGWMTAWLAGRYGVSWAEIPDDPCRLLHATIHSRDVEVRSESIRTISQLGDRRREFVEDLRKRLGDSEAEIRSAAFALWQSIAHQ